MNAYRTTVRPLLFRMDAEAVHAFAIRSAEIASASASACAFARSCYAFRSDRLAVTVAGMQMDSPLGLAAGFDKSARGVDFLASLGFDHVEVGSISAEPSDGNPQPRLFRIPRDRGIVVNYGLPNDGADAVAERLSRRVPAATLGINVVSTNRGPHSPQETDDAVIEDYLRSVARLEPFASYVTLNLSCPNTREGRGFFHDTSRLRRLLSALEQRPAPKPLFLKVAPFSNPADMDRFLSVVQEFRRVDGFSVNLPPGKPPGLATPADAVATMPGAVSGPPAAAAADRTIRDLYRRVDRSKHVIVGSGGISSAEDAYRKIRLGATLIQLMTALVYEGPGVANAVKRGLDRLLERDGFRRIGDAVGVDA